jgi:hypothetical protein
VRVGSLLGSLVELSDDNDLLTGLSTGEDNSDLSWLVDWRLVKFELRVLSRDGGPRDPSNLRLPIDIHERRLMLMLTPS